MRVAIIGSRNFPDMQRVRQYVESLDDVTVISGGARGVDTVAVLAAHDRLPCEVYEADWDKHGKQAGMIRNVEMLKTADKVVAFWNGESKGTRHAIDTALKLANVRQVIVVKG